MLKSKELEDELLAFHENNDYTEDYLIENIEKYTFTNPFIVKEAMQMYLNKNNDLVEEIKRKINAKAKDCDELTKAIVKQNIDFACFLLITSQKQKRKK